MLKINFNGQSCHMDRVTLHMDKGSKEKNQSDKYANCTGVVIHVLVTGAGNFSGKNTNKRKYLFI